MAVSGDRGPCKELPFFFPVMIGVGVCLVGTQAISNLYERYQEGKYIPAVTEFRGICGLAKAVCYSKYDRWVEGDMAQGNAKHYPAANQEEIRKALCQIAAIPLGLRSLCYRCIRKVDE